MIGDLFQVTLSLAAMLDLNSDDVLTQMYTYLLHKLVANYKTLGKPCAHWDPGERSSDPTRY